MAMRAGKLDRRIVIKKITEARDSFGGITETESTHLNAVPAFVNQVRGAELFGKDSKLAEVDTLFRIRYNGTITNKMFIMYNDIKYDIYQLKELGRREGLEILARAEVS